MLKPLGFIPTLPSLLTSPGIPLIHRDLSWLQFNERVLNEARDSSNPLLERVKFLSISAANMDEFFMIRYAGLARSITRLLKTDPAAAARNQEVRDNLLESVAMFVGRQADTFEQLASELETAGIVIARSMRAGDPGYDVGKKVFEEQILPHMQSPEPLAASSLTSLGNLESAIVFRGDRWCRLPKSLPPVYIVPMVDTPGIFVFLLDDLLMTYLEGAATLAPVGVLRLTRDGDFSPDIVEGEDPESIPDAVRSGIVNRDRGTPVRLQYLGNFSQAFLTQCLAALKLQTGQLIPVPGTMHFPGLWTLVTQCPESIAAGRPNLRHPPFEGRIPKIFENKASIFAHIRREDILLHHPYDSFDAFIRFLETACEDPRVRSIEQTVYRMDALSPVIEALKRAAGQGKQVRVIIELRARFDELNNLRLADELKKSGVEVAFGFGKLKLHAKIVLVTREEENGEIRQYTHVSTGNYNAATARAYTDLSVLTSRKEVGQDARHFFDAVLNEITPTGFKHLVGAPTRLHRRLLSHIDAEAKAAREGHPARIVVKVNALVDEGVIEQLYLASQAGVQIDLIVRGACSLIPGIQGLSENIRVISVVDRFLEHSRIYYFGHSKALYLSSADWMPRNLFSRIEIAFPVTDPILYRYLEGTLIPIYLSDAVKARELTALGTWKKRTVAAARQQVTPALKKLIRGGALRSQFLFEDLAKREYAETPLAERRFHEEAQSLLEQAQAPAPKPPKPGA